MHVPCKIQICDDFEYRKNVIGYIGNNPRKHHETDNPFMWPWSSIRICFDNNNVAEIHDAKILRLTHYQKQRMLGTTKLVPDSWKINQDGMLTYKSFVEPKMLENDVKSINSLTYLINKSNVANSDGEVEEHRANDRGVRELIVSMVPRLFPDLRLSIPIEQTEYSAVTPYGRSRINGQLKNLSHWLLSQLSASQKQLLSDELRNRFGIYPSVIRRVIN
jgi:hypothetical protein